MRETHATICESNLLEDEQGVAYVEFLISFIPVFMMFLGMMQAALMYAANLVVTHSANTAARAAIVVLPDDPDDYNGEQMNRVNYGGTSSPEDPLSAFLHAFDLPAAFSASGSSGSRRLDAVRSAASIPLLAVSPPYEALIQDDEVYRTIGGSPLARAATGAAFYNRMAVAVTFPERPGANTYRTQFGPDDQITVRVTYLFHCGIPLANRYMCDDYPSLVTGIPIVQVREFTNLIGSGRASQDEINGALTRMRQASERLSRARPGRNELMQAQSPLLGLILAARGKRFAVLRAEATLQNHGASYSY